MNSQHVTVENCFVRSFDDGERETVGGDEHDSYATGDQPVRDVTVSNCVVWND